MTDTALQALRYPVGEFVPTPQPSATQRAQWMATLSAFPGQVRERVNGRSSLELQRAYRPGGWNMKQLVHHCADSHLNAYIRFKLALTETNPIIKPYDEAAWAARADGQDEHLAPSLAILEGLHQRWVALMEGLTPPEWERTFMHPEHGKTFSLSLTLDNYDWHCRHHLAHLDLCLAGE